MGLRYVDPLPRYEPEIGRCFWALEEARRRTLRAVDDVDDVTLDWEGPDRGENAIGSLLYHIASTEMWWLFQVILQQRFPASLYFDIGQHGRGPEGRLTRVLGVPLADHLACLQRSREYLLEACRQMSLTEWRRLRHPLSRPDCEVTPEWTIFHLLEHEAGHAFQISALRARASRFFATQHGRSPLGAVMNPER